MAVTILPPLKYNSYHAFPSVDDKQREKGAYTLIYIYSFTLIKAWTPCLQGAISTENKS